MIMKRKNLSIKLGFSFADKNALVVEEFVTCKEKAIFIISASMAIKSERWLEIILLDLMKPNRPVFLDVSKCNRLI